MVDIKSLIPAIIAVILLFVILHLIVASLFPRLKTMFMGLTKDEKVANALVATLFFIITVYVVSALIPLLEVSTIPFISYATSSITAPIAVLKEFVGVLQWIVVAVVVALGLR